MNRQQAKIELKQTFGFDRFYDEQWETIDMLFQGKRMLLIEKTGFGKSLCFQFPATQFEGVTIVFSPLIALMRDQVKGLNEKGIKAKFINSEQSPKENTQTIQDAINGNIKILYIAPERQENQEWLGERQIMKVTNLKLSEWSHMGGVLYGYYERTLSHILRQGRGNPSVPLIIIGIEPYNSRCVS